jgi:hypothetical protein
MMVMAFQWSPIRSLPLLAGFRLGELAAFFLVVFFLVVFLEEAPPVRVLLFFASATRPLLFNTTV